MKDSVAHQAPEPAQALIAAMLVAACELGRLPEWFKKYPLQLTSPTARQVLWAIGRRVTQNPDAGFAMAERVPEDALGSLWSVYRAAPSLRVLSSAYNDWSALLLDFMDVHVIDAGALVWFRIVARDDTPVDRAEQDFRAAMLVKAWRRLHANAALAPLAAHFTYPRPRSVHAHAGALGTDQLRFAQPHLQLALSRVVADASIPGADAAEFERASAAARAEANRPRQASFPERVEELITERLVQGPSETVIARAVGLGVRTLRRRLRESGVTFRDLLDRARRREGDLYLEAAQLPMARVARLLGYAGDGALRNSMRRWSKLTPGER